MKNELLAPAGNIKIAKTAIDFGADAIYLAGKRFGARALISNFADEEIIDICKYAHIRGKKVYITLNTLIFEDEFDEVKEYIDFLYKYVDALIIQDFGILHYVRMTYPDFPIHLSTQCSIHNIEDILFLKNIGVSRVVLAREVSLEEIKLFNECGMGLEIFIHGALCFSYSGMCYLSYYQGERSGNRGNCAQPCRQNYELLEDGVPIKEGPLLSMKDLNTMNNLNELLKVGVSSLKIEGRAKGQEYVASSVKIYRKLIDNFNQNINEDIQKKMLDDLYVSFSREYTKGYLFNEKNKDITSDFSVKHQGILIGEVLNYKNKQVQIKLKNELNLNDGIRIIDGEKEIGCIVTRIFESGKMVKKSKDVCYIDAKEKINPHSLVYKTSSYALKKDVESYVSNEYIPADIEILIKQNYQYLKITVDSISIKKERHLTLEKMKNDQDERIISQFKKHEKLPIEYKNVKYSNANNLYFPITDINQLRNEALDDLTNTLSNRKERKYIPYNLKDNNFVKCRIIDEIVIDKYENDLINSSPLLKRDFAYHLSEIGLNSVISPYFGVTNHYSISFFRNFTNSVIVLSFESSLSNSLELSNYDKSLGYLIDFNAPLMVSKHCIVNKAYQKEEKNCGLCLLHKYKLKDRYEIYDLRFKNCYMFIEGKNIKRKSSDKLIDVIFK